MEEQKYPAPTRVPDVTFKTRVRDESVGGDNPSVCSSSHLPEYEKLLPSVL